MDLVFNELSLMELPESDIVAKEAMSDLIKSLIAIEKEYKSNISLRTLESFKNFIICQCELSIMSWLSGLDKVEKAFFLAVSSKKPFIHDYPYYIFEGKESKGFGYAYEFKLLSISYDPLKKWESTTYTINKQYIDEVSEHFQEEDVVVTHLVHNNVDYETKNFIQEKLKENTLFENLGVNSGNELVKVLDKTFTALKFTQTALDNIASLKAGDERVRSIYHQLIELNNFFLNWDGVPVNFGNLLPSKTTPESSSRLTALNDSLTLLCPDGKYRLFDWHQRFTPGPGRLYFYPDSTNLCCYIGYIGNKL